MKIIGPIDPRDPNNQDNFKKTADAFARTAARLQQWGPVMPATIPEEVGAVLASRTYFLLVELLKAAAAEDPDGEQELVYTLLLARLKALLDEVEEEVKTAKRKKVERTDAKLEELLCESESAFAYTPTRRTTRQDDDPSR